MAQWRRISALAASKPEVQKRLLLIYQRNKFNIDIRGQLADTIESCDWLGMDENNVEVAKVQFQSLLMALDTKISASSNDFSTKMRLDQEKHNLQDEFSGNLLDFVKVLKSCMNEERMLIESCETDHSDRRKPVEDRAKENPILTAKILEFGNAFRQAESELNQFSDHQSNFRIEYTNLTEQITEIGHLLRSLPNGMDRQAKEKEMQKMDADRAEKAKNNYEQRMSVGRKQIQLGEQLKMLINLVWREIDNWKNEMKLTITGMTKPKEGALDVLDNVCLRVNAQLMQMLSQMDKVISVFCDLKYESPNSPDEWIPKMTSVREELSMLLSQHLSRIFVVDRFPRILKVITAKSLGFTMSCRLLGAYSFNLQTMPKITAELHKEQDVMGALKGWKKGICEVVNGKDKPMDLIRTPQQLIGNFNSVQLQRVKQLDKSSDKLVMENRFGMVFYTSITIRTRVYNLSTYSQPMALISHVLQECMAKAFLIWDAAFSKSDSERTPFDHPNEVPWASVAKVLDALFKDNTGRGLTQDQLNYLGRVAFKEKKPGDYSKRLISKSALIKERLQKDFSFWKWFYANMNLIKERLKDEWNDGLIHGFISKEEILEKLLKCEPGTFMLRFSERTIENSSRADICGCLTLGVIDIDPSTEHKKIFHVKEHLSPKDIFERGLAQTLEAFEVKDYRTGTKRSLLTNLWPDKSFPAAFQKYLNKRPADDQDGYRSGQLRIEIFLTEDGARNNADPASFRFKSGTVTEPMSPTSTLGVASPAPSDASAYTTDGDFSSPFSPLESSTGNGVKAIAMVSPTMAVGSTGRTATQFSQMSLNNSSASSSGYNFPTPQPGYNSGGATNDTPMEMVEVLPQQVEQYMAHMNQLSDAGNMEALAGNAAQGLLDMNSGEINSGGDITSGGTHSSSGSGVIIEENGDMELPHEFVAQITASLN